MAARKNVSVRTIVAEVDRKTKALKKLKDKPGVDQRRLATVLNTLGNVREACMGECKATDFFVFPPGQPPGKPK